MSSAITCINEWFAVKNSGILSGLDLQLEQSDNDNPAADSCMQKIGLIKTCFSIIFRLLNIMSDVLCFLERSIKTHGSVLKVNLSE